MAQLNMWKQLKQGEVTGCEWSEGIYCLSSSTFLKSFEIKFTILYSEAIFVFLTKKINFNLGYEMNNLS